MKIGKNGIFFGNHYGIRWFIGESSNNGNGHRNFTISFFWKIGNGDEGNCILGKNL
jgi:hypothetical protein